MQFLWAATAVLLIAAAMRIVLLHDVPPGLARDEVRNGDIVQFIRQGEHALFFRAGYGHEPLYHYFSVPFQLLLGDNVLSIRLPSVVLGILLIALTMRWVKREFGGMTAVVTAFGLSVGWMPLIFSRIGIRAIMEPLFLVAAAWFWQKKPLVAGLLLGLSLYTYSAARVVFALPLFLMVTETLIWKMKPDGKLRDRLRPLLIIFVTAVLIYMPLQLTFIADPTLQVRAQQAQGTLNALLAGNVQPMIASTLGTLGLFSFSGAVEWTYTVLGLPLFDWVTAVFFYAGLLIALWRIRQPRYTFIIVWLLVGLIPSAITSPSIIRIIGAAPIMYLLPALSISFINAHLPAKKRRPYVLFLLIILYITPLTSYSITNGFIQWPSTPETHHKYQTVLQDMGRYWQQHPADGMVITQNFYEPIDADTMRRNMGYDIEARWVQAHPDVTGAMVIPDEANGMLYVPEYASPRPSLLEAAGSGMGERPLYRSKQTPSFAVYALSPPVIPTPITPSLLFDEKISLLGYKIGTQSKTDVEFFTYWQTEAPLPPDLTIFVHLIDDNGQLIAQHDGLDVAPSTLHPHDFIIQRHTLSLPADIAADSIPVYIGLYTRSTNTRLPIHNHDETASYIFDIGVVR